MNGGGEAKGNVFGAISDLESDRGKGEEKGGKTTFCSWAIWKNIGCKMEKGEGRSWYFEHSLFFFFFLLSLSAPPVLDHHHPPNP